MRAVPHNNITLSLLCKCRFVYFSNDITGGSGESLDSVRTCALTVVNFYDQDG
jgi:hypothetical protein